MARMMALFEPGSVGMAYRQRVAGIGFGKADGDAGCLEVLTYRLKGEADAASRYLETAKRLDALLDADGACLGRALYRPGADGEWLELLWYTDKPSAFRLYERIKDDPAMTDGARLVDETSMAMRFAEPDRKSTRLNSSHIQKSRMPSSA